MQTIGGVFESGKRALEALAALRSVGVAEKNLEVLMPGSDPAEFETKTAMINGSEGPGAWGAVGAGIGSFAGAAFMTAVIPGIGPILGLGALAAAFIAGGLGGKAAGDAIEGSSVHDDVGDDLHVFEDALRREKAIVIVMVDAKTDPLAVQSILRAKGGVTLDEAREGWWRARRDAEANYYESLGHGRTFDQAEGAYRKGFEAGCDPRYAGRTFESIAVKLRTRFHDVEEEDFRSGFQRAQELRWQQQREPATSKPGKARVLGGTDRASVPSVH